MASWHNGSNRHPLYIYSPPINRTFNTPQILGIGWTRVFTRPFPMRARNGSGWQDYCILPGFIRLTNLCIGILCWWPNTLLLSFVSHIIGTSRCSRLRVWLYHWLLRCYTIWRVSLGDVTPILMICNWGQMTGQWTRQFQSEGQWSNIFVDGQSYPNIVHENKTKINEIATVKVLQQKLTSSRSWKSI